MKCIRNAGSTVYSRLNNKEAAEMVATGNWVYTSKKAYKAFYNRSRKRFYTTSKNTPSNRTLRSYFKTIKRPRISNANSTDGTKAHIQRINSEPAKTFVERYLPKSALKKVAAGEITQKQAMKTLAKNRYVKNNNATVVKAIKHVKPLNEKLVETNIKS